MKFQVADKVKLSSRFEIKNIYKDDRVVFQGQLCEIVQMVPELKLKLISTGLVRAFNIEDLDKRYIPRVRTPKVHVIVIGLTGYNLTYVESFPFKAELIEYTEHEIRVKSVVTGAEYSLPTTDILEYLSNEEIVKSLTP